VGPRTADGGPQNVRLHRQTPHFLLVT
jgi:hypothetical protein